MENIHIKATFENWRLGRSPVRRSGRRSQTHPCHGPKTYHGDIEATSATE